MKKLIAAASLSLLATTAIAQDTTVPAEPETGAAESTATEALPPPVDPGEVSAEMIAGADVFSIEGNDIGTVRDIVFTSSGELDSAVISVGGFLGFGRHTVAIPVDELTVMEKVDSEGEMIVQVPLTKDQMKALPEYEVVAEPVEAETTEPVTQ